MPIDALATRFNPPFSLEPARVFWMLANPYTVNPLDAIKRKPRFANLSVAIIDLSARARRPDGSGWMTSDGWNMDDQRFVASLAKIGALFAAFRLRYCLRLAANETSAKTGAEAFKMVTDDWKGVVQTAIPAGKPDFPQFDKIFTIRGATGAWNIQFTDEYLGHLKLMIGHSDNHSASVCIDRLGFQYINGALEAEGLYVPGRGGIWLGANYAGRAWMVEPSKKLTFQGATASSVARFLTLLEDDRLISADDSADMRDIMRLAGTWLEQGLSRAKPPRPIIDIYAKIGLYGTSHDCGVIQRSDHGKPIRYAAVILGAPDPQVIRDLVVKLDDYIIANN